VSRLKPEHRTLKVKVMVPRVRILSVFSIARQIAKILFVLLFAAASLQCQSIQYYGQAIDGQMHILRNRQPISELVDDPATPQLLRKKLLLILAVRNFAEKELQLPVNNHYLSYVDLKRPYVVWNVYAAAEFSLTPRTWCFPIVGCVAYRGYFSEQLAQRYADSLKKKGDDVFIGGAIAYSTLGWFDDPVLSTVLTLSDSQTAALIFHELAHSVLYVADDTAFNESFATAVEQEGLRRWQAANNDIQGFENWVLKQQGHQIFIRLILKYRAQLEALYQSKLSITQKRNKKAAIFNHMRAEYTDLKSEWGGPKTYDAWFNYPLNNAQIISVSTYHNYVPAFGKMLAETAGNLQKFYEKCRVLAKKEQSQRHRLLKQYLD
jgi:predicted aminopeptidase